MTAGIAVFYESGGNQTHKMQVLEVPATLSLFWALGIWITFFTEHKKSTHFIDSKIHSLGLSWWLRLNAGGLGFYLIWGTRSHMPQLRIPQATPEIEDPRFCMLQRKPSTAKNINK